MNKSGIRPVEYRVLVKPEKVEKMTAGGIYLPDQTHEKDKYAVMKGVLVAVSPDAFTNPQWLFAPKVGDTVLFDRYAGGNSVIGADGEEYRLMNDKEIGAVYE